MTDPNQTIVEFLTARLDEDERQARAAGGGHYGIISHRAKVLGKSDLAEMHPVRRLAEVDDADDAWAEHAVRHAPAHVLADIAAKRRILERVLEMGPPFGGADRELIYWTLLDVVRDLASVHSDHPDYQQEWAMEPPAEPAPTDEHEPCYCGHSARLHSQRGCASTGCTCPEFRPIIPGVPAIPAIHPEARSTDGNTI